MSFIRYYRDVCCRAIRSAWAICGFVSGVIAFLGGYIGWKYPQWGATVNNLLWMIPLSIFLLFILIGWIVAPYQMHKELKNKIRELQNKPVSQNAKPDTKQDIRSFLEAFNPLILEKIDSKEKKIPISISQPEYIKLVHLSENPDFSKFLSFSECAYINGGRASLIKDIRSTGKLIPSTTDYYLYPKDSLIK